MDINAPGRTSPPPTSVVDGHISLLTDSPVNVHHRTFHVIETFGSDSSTWRASASFTQHTTSEEEDFSPDISCDLTNPLARSLLRPHTWESTSSPLYRLEEGEEGPLALESSEPRPSSRVPSVGHPTSLEHHHHHPRVVCLVCPNSVTNSRAPTPVSCSSARSTSTHPHGGPVHLLHNPLCVHATIRSPHGRYVRRQRLAKGQHKEVYRAFDEEECLEVAWNEIECSSYGVELERIQREIDLLRDTHHPNIIRLMDSWTDESRRCVVFITELMSSGTLKDFIATHIPTQVNPKIMQRWCRQILHGLQYLHERDIMHRDLKCDNIFINGHRGEVKIGDMGLSVSGVRRAKTVTGTPEFMAPEIYEEHYTNAVDIWSFGMCVLEIATREYPYAECSNVGQVFRKVSNGCLPLSLDLVQHEGIRDMILTCLRVNPAERPTATQLLECSFLRPREDTILGGHSPLGSSMYGDKIDLRNESSLEERTGESSWCPTAESSLALGGATTSSRMYFPLTEDKMEDGVWAAGHYLNWVQQGPSSLRSSLIQLGIQGGYLPSGFLHSLTSGGVSVLDSERSCATTCSHTLGSTETSTEEGTSSSLCNHEVHHSQTTPAVPRTPQACPPLIYLESRNECCSSTPRPRNTSHRNEAMPTPHRWIREAPTDTSGWVRQCANGANNNAKAPVWDVDETNFRSNRTKGSSSRSLNLPRMTTTPPCYLTRRHSPSTWYATPVHSSRGTDLRGASATMDSKALVQGEESRILRMEHSWPLEVRLHPHVVPSSRGTESSAQTTPGTKSVRTPILQSRESHSDPGLANSYPEPSCSGGGASTFRYMDPDVALKKEIRSIRGISTSENPDDKQLRAMESERRILDSFFQQSVTGFND